MSSGDYTLGTRGLSGGGGRSGPDWITLVKNKVAVVLDDKKNIILRGGVRMPDSFIVMSTAQFFVSYHKGLYKTVHTRNKRMDEGKPAY